MKTRTGLVLAGAALAVALSYTVWDLADGTEQLDPAPLRSPSMPEGVELVRVPRGGALYDCVVDYNGGIFCWDDPAVPSPTPPTKGP